MPPAPFPISHSKVQAFRQCRKKYWFGYVSGLPRPHEPMNIPGLIGNAVHRGMRVLCEARNAALGRNDIEVYLRQEEHGLCGPGTDGYERALEYFAAGVEVHEAIESDASWAEKDLWYRNSPAVEITARADRIDQLKSGEWQVIDWKTGAELDDQTDEQLDLAHVAARSAIPSIPAGAEVRTIAWNLRRRAADAAYRPRSRVLRRQDAVATVARYEAIARTMSETADFPAMPGRYCAFCAWRGQCPEAEAFDSAAADASWNEES